MADELIAFARGLAQRQEDQDAERAAFMADFEQLPFRLQMQVLRHMARTLDERDRLTED